MTTYPQYFKSQLGHRYMVKSDSEFIEVLEDDGVDMNGINHLDNEDEVKRIMKRFKRITAKEFGEAFIEAITALKDAVNECFAPQISPETLHRISEVVNERA